MKTHIVTNKEVYNKRRLDPHLVEYLERWSGKKLTKLYLEPWNSEEERPFWRWYLEGIQDLSYKANTNNPLSHLHSALRLPLQEFFGEDLLRVCQRYGDRGAKNGLTLDFKTEEGIFQKIDPEAFERWKDIPPHTYRAAENSLIKIPYITILF